MTSAAMARVEELLDLVHDRVEVAGLVAALVRVRVAVHRVARPHDRVARPLHRPQAAAAASRRPARRPCGSRARAGRARGPGRGGGTARPPLRAWPSGRASRRSGSARPTRNSTCAPSIWRVRSPIHSRCAEQSYQSPVRLSRPRQRFLVAEQQRLVRRVEVDLVQLHLGGEVDAARGHEPQRALDAVGDLFVAAGLHGRSR